MPSKTVIGVLASRDDYEVNRSLLVLFNRICDDTDKQDWRRLIEEEFQLVFTGGTYERVINGEGWLGPQGGLDRPAEWRENTSHWLRNTCRVVRLPSARDGGVTVLANLIAYRQCSILWCALSSATSHWINPENLALMRLCDHWRVKRLMNTGSIIEWIRTGARQDVHRNKQKLPLRLQLSECRVRSPMAGIPGELFEDDWHEQLGKIRRSPGGWNDAKWRARDWGKMTVALIAHDDMKQRMVDFALDFGPELGAFGRILTTSTTGKDISDAVPELTDRIRRCHSGPKGGDIQIATEIVLGYCDVVIFFVDTLHPHPHIDDIRVVFGACMAQPSVRMITNEFQAREWMETVVRSPDRNLPFAQFEVKPKLKNTRPAEARRTKAARKKATPAGRGKTTE